MFNLDCCWICLWEFSVAKSCPTLCNPMDSSLPGFSVRVIFQARILEWVTISSSLSAIRVVSSSYLRLLIFLPAIWNPACASSSPAFHSAYKLNKQGNNIQPWCTPFPIWNQSVVPCPVLLLPDLYIALLEKCKSKLQSHHTSQNGPHQKVYKE